MISSLNFLYTVFAISIGMYITSAIITAMFIIPLQFKLSLVKNGLIKLRKQLLIVGVFILLVMFISIFVLTARFFIHDTDILRYTITSMIFLHASSFLVLAVLLYQIYHQQYTPENQKLHAKLAKLEKRNKV